MANQEVTIENAPGGPGAKYMVVNRGFFAVEQGDIILFKNSLQSPFSEVQVRFYPAGVKDPSTLISGFCSSVPGDYLPVPAASNAGGTITPGAATCTVAMGGTTARTYEYTVSATSGNYETLDPVIIVEGGGGVSLLGVLGTLGGLGLIAVTGLALKRLKSEYQRGFKDGQASNQDQATGP